MRGRVDYSGFGLALAGAMVPNIWPPTLPCAHVPAYLLPSITTCELKVPKPGMVRLSSEMTGVSPAHLTGIGMGSVTSRVPYLIRAVNTHKSAL